MGSSNDSSKGSLNAGSEKRTPVKVPPDRPCPKRFNKPLVRPIEKSVGDVDAIEGEKLPERQQSGSKAIGRERSQQGAKGPQK